MSINFIPNDPQAGPTAPQMRVTAKRPNRPAGRATFTLAGGPAEGTFDPGTSQFLFWQSREAGLSALAMWDAVNGPFKAWQGNRKKIPLFADKGVDLNAFYDRNSFQFFHKAVAGQTLFSGASTDVVSHEVGHGLLDSMRPDMWDSMFLESGAFHEGYADCMAILTALHDQETREKVLAVTSDLRKPNFVESTAEDLSAGIKKLIPTHNAAEPRHALNKFQFQIPETLPSDGGPGELIDEVHSFGMLISGCFYDLISNLFAASTQKDEAGLLAAAQAAGRLFVAGVKTAPLVPRFLQSVGRSMILADDQNGGANRDPIRNAFEGHGILLGSNAMVAHTAALAGSAPSLGRAAALAPATRKDLLNRLGNVKGAKLSLSAVNLFGERVVRAVHQREIPLGSLSSSLRGVVARAEVPVSVGASGNRASLVGVLQEPVFVEAEVHSFVKSLLKHDRIEFGRKKDGGDGSTDGCTHAVKTVGGKKVLQRIRFRCCFP